jgi:2-amino-4-hydroxy-6-hydroxymethyldihydropteridine diphosphokinase
MSEALCHIALGANLGDRIGALREATRRIGQLPETAILARSAIYETPPWGKIDQAPFANAVIAIRTGLGPKPLLDACLGIETAMGRVRRERWGPRLIDIDLLTHGTTRMTSDRLTLPHPAIAERAFVLVPLLEIAPEFRIGRRKGSTILNQLDQAGIVAIAPL